MNFKKLTLFVLLISLFSGALAKDVALSRITNKTANAIKIVVKKVNGEVIKSADALPKGEDLSLPVTLDKIGSIVVNETELSKCYPPFTTNEMSFVKDKKNVAFYNILEIVADEEGAFKLNCTLEIFVG